mgnify:CR=1 FL=1
MLIFFLAIHIIGTTMIFTGILEIFTEILEGVWPVKNPKKI